jgi:hypothetical protein
MTNYNECKSLVIGWDEIIGFITLEDLIIAIEEFISFQKEFDKDVLEIINSSNLSSEAKTKLLENSSTELIEFVIKLIKDEL